MTYKIVKINAKTEQEINYGGGYTADDVKAITKGYTFDGLMYNRKNSVWFFIVTAE